MGPASTLAVLIAAAGAAQTAQAARTATTADFRTVDMVVADIDGAIVTYSELLAEANLLLLESRGPRVARAALLGRPLLRAVLLSMVHRELLLGEIRRLQLRPVDGSEVDRRLVKLRRRFSDESDWQRFLVEAGFRDPGSQDLRVPAALRARLRAEAQVDRFLEVRVRLNVVVTDGDVAYCFAARRAVFGSARVDVVAPRIEAQLRRQREADALADLLEQLTDRAQVRYHPRFEPPSNRPRRAPIRAPGSGFTCPDGTQKR